MIQFLCFINALELVHHHWVGLMLSGPGESPSSLFETVATTLIKEYICVNWWSLFFSLCLLINMLCRNWKGDLDDGNGKIYHELMIQTKFRNVPLKTFFFSITQMGFTLLQRV